ncbi:MAG: HypC/HybG/HupF family hydrogenase formation chaperone [Verrucomicrobia bacterium]|nr:HypC/HybG/HupF family hydrogenase formation chaperone [Verrucomicrobiota bacterium]
MCLAVPGRLLEISGADEFHRMGRVSFGGVVKSVSLACVPEAQVNDHVLVHVGVALSVIDEEEAAKIFAHLSEMGELADLDPGPPP